MPPIATAIGRGMGVLSGGVYEIQVALGGAEPEHEGEGFDNLADVERFAIASEIAPVENPPTDVERAQQIQAYALSLIHI